MRRHLSILLLFSACVEMHGCGTFGQEITPAAVVDVALSLQQAAEDESPVLPDDYAKNDPARISATWKAAPSSAPPAKFEPTRRYTQSELIDWVKENYTRQTQILTDVNPRSNVWNHLRNDHGFDSNQVNGLDQWIALALHDAAHSNKITAWKQATIVFPSADAMPAGIKAKQFTLFTADGNWCDPCKKQAAELLKGGVSFSFKKVLVPSEGQSPSGSVPCWQAPDGEILKGNYSIADLNAWAKKHPGNTVAQSSDLSPAKSGPPVVEVELDASSGNAVLLALAAHVQRLENPQSSASSSDPQAVQSWLPEIDVDVDDSLLKILDGMLKGEGFQSGGLTIGWPAGKRQLVFDPPVKVRFRKILEVDVEIKSISIEGRTVTLNLTGKFLSTLVVRLK